MVPIKARLIPMLLSAELDLTAFEVDAIGVVVVVVVAVDDAGSEVVMMA